MPGRIVAFDFDGVICDSTRECLLVAWNAWSAFQGGRLRRYDLSEFSDEEIRHFSDYRGYCRRVNDYLIYFRLLTSKALAAEQSLFDAKARLWAGDCLRYRTLFFEERRALRTISEEAWLSLHVFHPEAVEWVRRLNSRQAVYVVSLKDAKSVELLLTSREVELPAGHLFGEGSISTKLEGLDLIARAEKVPANDVLLIDDNLHHLTGPLRHGYSCFLADWGYHSPEQLKLAESLEVGRVGLADLDARIGEWLTCAT